MSHVAESNLIELIKRAEEVASDDARYILSDVLFRIGGTNSWVNACRDAVCAEELQLLMDHARVGPTESFPWVLRMFHSREENPKPHQRSLYTRLLVAQSIAGVALSALLCKQWFRSSERNRKDLSLIVETLYRAAIRWQPADRTGGEISRLGDSVVNQACDSILCSASAWAGCSAVLRLFKANHPWWELAPLDDLCRYFLNEPDGQWEKHVTICIPVVRRKGTVVRVEMRGRKGRWGEIYRDPLSMSMLRYDESFGRALQLARAYAISKYGVQGYDVRWQLVGWGANSKPNGSAEVFPDQILGSSVGAGYAVGLEYLLNHKYRAEYCENWAITGAISSDGLIEPAHDYAEKLQAVAAIRNLKAIVPSNDWQRLRDEFPAENIKDLLGASTVGQAAEIITGNERGERRTRVLRKTAAGLGVAATVLLVVAAYLAFLYHRELAVATERGRQLQIKTEQLDHANSQLKALNGVLEGKNTDLNSVNDRLEDEKAYAQEQEQLAVKQGRVAETARQQEQQQRRVAEEQREEARRQRGIAEEQRALARARLQLATARQAEMQADRAMVENRSQEARLLYAKALTLDEQESTRGRYLDAKAKPFMKRRWTTSETYGSGDIELSPDGRQVAVVDGERGVRLLDADTGRQVSSIKDAEGEIRNLSFSPDGRMLATSVGDQTVSVWDVSTGDVMRRFSVSTNSPGDSEAKQTGEEQSEESGEGSCCEGMTRAITFTQDGKRLAAVVGHLVWVWNISSGKSTQTFAPTILPISSLAFSNKGDLAVGAASGEILVQLADGKTYIMTGHGSPVADLTFNRDSNLITAGAPYIRVWDFGKSGTKPVQTLKTGEAQHITLSYDGHLAVLGDPSGTTKILDIRTSREIYSFVSQHQNTARASRTVVGIEGQVVIKTVAGHVSGWRVARSRGLYTLEGHRDPVHDFEFSSDSKNIVSVDSEGILHIWEAESSREIRRVELTKLGFGRVAARSEEGDVYLPPIGVMFRPGRNTVAVTGVGQKLPLFDIFTGKIEGTFSLPVHEADEWQASTCGAFSSDGNHFAAGDIEGNIHIWEANTREAVAVLTGHKGPVTSLKFSPDGRSLSSSSFDRTVRVWNVSTRKIIKTFRNAFYPFTSVAYSPNGKTLASSAMDQKIRLWDLESGREILNLETFDSRPVSVTFSPDGRFLIWGSWSQSKVRMFDLKRGRELPPLRGAEGAVVRVAFSPDGKILAAGGEGDSVTMWDMLGVTQDYLSPPSALLDTAKQETGLELMGVEMEGVLSRQDLYAILQHNTESRFWTIPAGQDPRTVQGSCYPLPIVATLNPFPLTFTSPAEICKVYPPLDLRLVSGGRYSTNEVTWEAGLRAKAGDEVYALMYIDNGVANNMPPEQAVAKNISVKINVDTNIGSEHPVSVSFGGVNTNWVSKTLSVRTGPNEYLEIVPHSGELFDYRGNPLKQGFAVGNSAVSLGDLEPGFATDLFFRFKMKVKTEDKARHIKSSSITVRR